MESERTNAGAVLELQIPVRDGDLFKHGASEGILDLLADNPDLQLSVSQLSRSVPFSKPATRTAIDVLEANDLVETTRRGNKRLVQIDRDRLRTATDPVLSIPQGEFHLPVRIARRLVRNDLENVLGIVLFGSVARGDADRKSDVDLWVLVDADPALQQHDATKLAAELSELRLPATIDLSSLVGDFSDYDTEDGGSIEQRLIDAYQRGRSSTDGRGGWEEFMHEQLVGSGQRYDFEILVESPESFTSQLDSVDSELFTEGITLYDTPALQALKSKVIGDE